MNFYDLETRSWTKPLSAAFVATSGEEWYQDGPNCFVSLARQMVRRRGKWAAHYGGGFDHLVILPFLRNLGLSIVSVILTGSRLYSVKFDNGLELLDTFPAWLCGLEAVGKYLKLPKIKHDRKTLSSLTKQELRDYNLRDCHIIRRGWKAAEEYSASVGMRHKKTAGSAAIEAIRVLEPQTYQAWTRNRLHFDQLTTMPNIAPGGLTDNFAIGWVQGLYYDDIKSSYPFSYSDPFGMVAGCEDYPPNKSSWNDPLVCCEVEWFLDASRDGETIAPAKDATTGLSAGVCRNWLTYDERVLLEEDKRVSRVRQLAAYGPTERLPDACKDFQRILFMWKENGAFFAKVWINSLHGKFCERCIKDTWNRERPDESFLGNLKAPTAIDGVGLWRFDSLSVDEEGYADPHYQPLCGALVYGRARARIIRIARTIQNAGYRVFYIDTDSCIHDCPPEVKARLGLNLGNSIGQLASEGGPYHGYILGRKLYYLQNDDGSVKKIAAKGVPMKRLDKSGKVAGMYFEKSKGNDYQMQIFKEIWEQGSAKILRTGVTPFVQGAQKGQWGKFSQARTLRPVVGNKYFDSDGRGHYMAGAV